MELHGFDTVTSPSHAGRVRTVGLIPPTAHARVDQDDRGVTVIGRVRSWSGAARERALALAERPDRARLFMTGMLALIVAVQLGWLIVALVTPPATTPSAVSAVRADLGVLSRFDAFFRTGGASSLAEVTAAGAEQLRLFGVRSGGGGGSAIIGLPDGRQVSVAVGEEIEPGLTLTAVGPDYATVSRGGSISRLTFGETPLGAAAPPEPPTTDQVVAPPAPAAAEAAVVDPQALLTQASLRPRMRGLAVTGFTVGAAGDAPALRAAGLQGGDVITAVDDIPLDGIGRLNELRSRLASAPQAEIRFERDGQTRTTVIRTGR